MPKYVLFCPLLLKILQQPQCECANCGGTDTYFLSTAFHLSVLYLAPLSHPGRKEYDELIHGARGAGPFHSSPEEGSSRAALSWEMGQVTISLTAGHMLLDLQEFWCQKERHFQKTSADKSLCPGTIPIEAECLHTVLFSRLA